MNQQQQPRTLPSFSGLSSAVNEARDYEKSRSSGALQQDVSASGNIARRHISETAPNALDVGRQVPLSASVPSKTDASGNILVQDTLTPLLDEVDELFERSKEIVASIAAQGKQCEEDVRACSLDEGLAPTNMCLQRDKSVDYSWRAAACGL